VRTMLIIQHEGLHASALHVIQHCLTKNPSPATCSIGGQELLAGFAADKTDWGDRPWITSDCHCSSTASSR